MEYKKLILFVAYLFFYSSGTAQDQLVVLSKQGKPTVNQELLRNGQLIKEEDIIQLNEGDEALLTDEEGDLYSLRKRGNFTREEIESEYKQQQKGNLTTDYLRFVWQEATQKSQTTDVGAVFRTNQSLMIQPVTNSYILGKQVRFQWKEHENETYYLIIRNTSTSKKMHVVTNGTFLELPVDGTIIQQGITYEWTVVTRQYTNPDELIYNTFRATDKEEYKQLLLEKEKIREGLQQFAISETDIEQLLEKRYHFVH